MKRKAIVIGAGIAGIASALRLRHKGYEVEVFEAHSKAGGKLNEHRQAGCRFDRGPSLFTMPFLVDELFELFGENPRDHFNYSKLKNTCKYFYEDGSIINAWADQEHFMREIGTKTDDAPESLFRFLEQSRLLYNITSYPFLFSSFKRISNYFTKPYLKAFVNLHRINALRTMHKQNEKSFRDKRLVQLFDRYATYNGSNPYQAPATLNVIAHLEHNIGAYFPDKGMYAITESLVDLSFRHGIVFHFNQRIDEVIVHGKKLAGVRSGNEIIPADVVVSDCDVITLYKNLLHTLTIPSRIMKAERSSSALIFYWGVSHTFPQLELHNILFSASYEEEFDYLFRKKDIIDDPTVYIFISSKQVKSDAPEGCENWFVMINAPENTGQEWNKMIEQARNNIKAKINRLLSTDIDRYIEFEDILDPVLIEKRTSSWHGSLYGNSSNSRLSAFSRHHNFLRKIKGLYFTGGSVHPGGGIPLCLSSAKIIDKEIKHVR